jgi:aspartate beta-hydroxylase
MANTTVMEKSMNTGKALEINSAGMTALKNGDFAAAENLFMQAVEHDPHAGALWRNVATARRAQVDTAGEMQALNAAIDLDRLDFMALLRKAELHQRIGDDVGALPAWQAVLQLASRADRIPDNIQPALQAGRKFLDSANAQLAEAVGSNLEPVIETMGETDARRSQAFVDLALGRRRSFFNQCEGVYYPFLPADEFFDRRHFGWMPELEAATADISAELTALLADAGDALRPYVRMDKGLPDNKWSGLDHSLDWSACFLWEYGEPNRAVLGRCPKTASALAAVPAAHIPKRAPSAFFSILKPKTRIPAHTGVTNTRAIVHLPLIVPPGCGFRVGGETREWQEGKAFAFDDTIEHEAWNDSDELRAVLIFDVWNPHLSISEQQLITQYFAAADSTGLNPAR